MKFLTLPFIAGCLLVLGLSYGCDGENTLSAEGPGGVEDPGAEPSGCPCFTMDDVIGMMDGAAAVSCENTVWGLSFIFNEADPTEVFAECSPEGSGCVCFGPTTGNSNTSVSVGEASTCVHIMINSLIEFAQKGFQINGCTFIPVGG